MQRVNCWICGNDKYRHFCKKGEYDIVKCKKCDFVFVNPPPSQANLSKFYKRFDYKSPQSAEPVIRKDARRSLQVISKFDREKFLLDMGCGRGYFLDEARKSGWIGKGIDYSKDVISYGRDHLNLDVEVGNILSYRTNRKFSSITLNQVIEHILDPEELIKHCREILNPNGHIYIASPNIESLSARIFGCDFEHLIPPEHVSFFSQKTLERLLKKNGFNVVYRGSWSYPQNLAGIIKKFIYSRKNIIVNKNTVSTKDIDDDVSFQKRIKYKIFDVWFCNIFYKFLEIDSFGINLEIVARKN